METNEMEKTKAKRMLKLGYALIAIIILAVVLYVARFIVPLALVNYVDRHAYDIDYDKLPQPLSTRGLPVPETDVPVVLPPDPGEAGKATLAGIDSNNDGVRDDLEREIVYMYPQNEEVRRVLRAMVKLQQQFITTEGNHEYFEGLRVTESTFRSCADYLVFPVGSYDPTNTRILSAMLLNTKERKRKDEQHQKLAVPYVGSPVSSASACEAIRGQY